MTLGQWHAADFPAFVQVAFAQGQAKLKGDELSQPQTLSYSGSRLSVGYGHSFFFGIDAEYGWFRQTTPVNALDGNFSGWRALAAPFLAVRSNRFILKGNYQFAGDFHLDKNTSRGSRISYTSPQGGGLSLHCSVYANLHVGFGYEIVVFHSRIDNALPATSSHLEMNVASAEVGYVF